MDKLHYTSLLFLFILLSIHPILIYPLTLGLLKRFGSIYKSDATVEKGLPTISICICAYNEASVIRQRAENLLSIKRRTPNLEILVYVDGATDTTADILREYERDLTLVVSAENTGKTVGMQQLVRMATGDIVVFSDANVIFAQDSVERLVSKFADPSVGCVCGRLVYTNPEASMAADVGAGYWRFEERLKELECATGSTICADGSIFAIRRQLYPVVPDDIIDDFYVSLSVLCDGFRIVCAPDAIAWEESATSTADEFRRKVRISCQAFNVHRLMWSRLITCDGLTIYKYVSHKLLRWLVPFNLAGAGLSALALGTMVLGWEVLVSAGICALMVPAGWAVNFRPAARIVEVLSAFTATGLGLVQSLSGRRFQTWKPATSARRGTSLTLETTLSASGESVLAMLDHAQANPVPLHACRIKRAMDLLGALSLLVLCLPLMLFIAALVRMDGSPAIFSHSRIGVGNKRFACLKFRTMHVDAERMLAEHLASDPAARLEWQTTFKLRHDPRITTIGRLLRKTSLDELPQLINVLRGEMSLVGPRPIVDAEIGYYSDFLVFYLQCRPGITGLWQVSGRSDIGYEQRVHLDRTYVENWSVRTDLAILLRTPGQLIRCRGAY
jgi:lipopolysaccharide/colanic/teichoic acid biosynthesis glycosyltransferase/cellulose synthase/poly-beta-1,6-N-acetylglucosamine synthase-like glycosyltransferase